MSKKLTPLQALKEFKNLKYLGVDVENTNEYKVIETALKEQNQLKIDYEEMNRINDELNLDNHQLRDENIKLKKALEVLKECFDFEGFDEFIPNGKWFEKDIEERKEILKELTKWKN